MHFKRTVKATIWCEFVKQNTYFESASDLRLLSQLNDKLFKYIFHQNVAFIKKNRYAQQISMNVSMLKIKLANFRKIFRKVI